MSELSVIRKSIAIIASVVLVAGAVVCWKVFSGRNGEEFVPDAPDYSDPQLWVRADGDADGTGADVFYLVSTWELDWTTPDGKVCHYADVYNPQHQSHMKEGEIGRVAAYMGAENNFYGPVYRHTTIEAFLSRDESIVADRFFSVPMKDIQSAFDYFIAHRDPERPLVLAGFSQGAKAVVELIKSMDDETFSHLVAAYVMGYKITPGDTMQCKRFHPACSASDVGVTVCYNTVKAPEYAVDVLSVPNVMCINPVNWHTDAEPAILHDTITVSVNPEHHLLVVGNYSGCEYMPFRDFINVGDIHGCEPWLYSDCIRQNIRQRTQAYRLRYQLDPLFVE